MPHIPVDQDARTDGAQGLQAWFPDWTENTDCPTGSHTDHDHDDCQPTAWWPGTDQVSAAVIRGLIDAGWTITKAASPT